MYIVYLLKCADGSLYCGITTNVKRRFREHKAGKGGNYTRSHGGIKMVYIEKCKNRSSALKREVEIKRLSRADKLLCIKISRESRSNSWGIDQASSACDLSATKNYFQALVEAIAGQQLSGKAAQTILDRVLALFKSKKFPTPQEYLKMSDTKLRSAGFSNS